jgi:hypothetical protein
MTRLKTNFGTPPIINSNRFPIGHSRYYTHAYSFRTKRSEPGYKSPRLPLLSDIDSNDQKDETDLFYIDLYLRFGCKRISFTEDLDDSQTWFERYREIFSLYSDIRPESGMSDPIL